MQLNKIVVANRVCYFAKKPEFSLNSIQALSRNYQCSTKDLLYTEYVVCNGNRSKMVKLFQPPFTNKM